MRGEARSLPDAAAAEIDFIPQRHEHLWRLRDALRCSGRSSELHRGSLRVRDNCLPVKWSPDSPTKRSHGHHETVAPLVVCSDPGSCSHVGFCSHRPDSAPSSYDQGGSGPCLRSGRRQATCDGFLEYRNKAHSINVLVRTPNH